VRSMPVKVEFLEPGQARDIKLSLATVTLAAMRRVFGRALAPAEAPQQRRTIYPHEQSFANSSRLVHLPLWQGVLSMRWLAATLRLPIEFQRIAAICPLFERGAPASGLFSHYLCMIE